MRIDLKWGENTRDGKRHTELHAPCGCAFHQVPSPHWHVCMEHKHGFKLQELRDEHEREITEEIRRRDYWEDQATELARLVGRHLGQDFGEHSSANCPVANAIEFLE